MYCGNSNWHAASLVLPDSRVALATLVLHARQRRASPAYGRWSLLCRLICSCVQLLRVRSYVEPQMRVSRVRRTEWYRQHHIHLRDTVRRRHNSASLDVGYGSCGIWLTAQQASGDQKSVRAGCLTIVGGVRDALAAWRLGRWKTLCALGASRALLRGPSTSPLGSFGNRFPKPVARRGVRSYNNLCACTWDPAKRAKTLAERGLDFHDAGIVFAGVTVEIEDTRKDLW